MGKYEKLYGCKPREYTSPLEKGDHPEVETSDELDNEVIMRYQTMIGCLQWDVFPWKIGYIDRNHDNASLLLCTAARALG
jgi:hypothetical protein